MRSRFSAGLVQLDIFKTSKEDFKNRVSLKNPVLNFLKTGNCYEKRGEKVHHPLFRRNPLSNLTVIQVYIYMFLA